MYVQDPKKSELEVWPGIIWAPLFVFFFKK